MPHVRLKPTFALDAGRLEELKGIVPEAFADGKIDWETLLKSTEGYSGADISNVCREASLMPFRKYLLEHTNIEEIASNQSKIDIPLTMEDFKQALKNISKSVSTEFLHKYAKWMKDFGST